MRGPPEAQRVDDAVLVTGDHVVVAQRHDAPGRRPAPTLTAVLADVGLDVPAEVLGTSISGARHSRARHGQPGVRLLDLSVVDEGLLEDAVLVANAVGVLDAPRVAMLSMKPGARRPGHRCPARLDLLLAQVVVDLDAAGHHRLGGDVGTVRRQQALSSCRPRRYSADR